MPPSSPRANLAVIPPGTVTLVSRPRFSRVYVVTCESASLVEERRPNASNVESKFSPSGVVIRVMRPILSAVNLVVLDSGSVTEAGLPSLS